jgi:hypothetical protein
MLTPVCPHTRPRDPTALAKFRTTRGSQGRTQSQRPARTARSVRWRRMLHVACCMLHAVMLYVYMLRRCICGQCQLVVTL